MVWITTGCIRRILHFQVLRFFHGTFDFEFLSFSLTIICYQTTVFGSWNAANVFLSVPDISSAADAARDIIALLRETNTSAEESLPAPDDNPRTVDGHLSLRNVSFRYPSRPEALILDNLSVDIPKGAHIAFVGASGSGKSTM